MRLSARHVGELARELAPLLTGRTLREAAARPPRDLLLVFAPPEGEERGVLRLAVSVDPDAPRVHLQTGRLRRHGGPVGPFYRRLGSELEGARLTGLSQVEGDRVLRLELTRGDARRALVVELAGRHGNLVLLDERERVLDLLVPPPSSRRAREAGAAPRLAVGEPWRLPPGAPPPDPGPPLAEALPAPAEDAGGDPRAPLSRRVEASLGAAARERERERERTSLRQRLTRKRKGARSLVAGLERRREAARGAERLRMDGELLKSELGRVKRGMREVVVHDWFEEGAPRAIELDPKLGPRQNLERVFARYQKLVRGGEAVERESELAEARVELYDGLLARLEDEDPAALEAEAVDAGLLEPRERRTHRDRPAERSRLPYKSYRGVRGSEIRVGRSARDNDALCSRHARGNDLWLHTADAPGSHVVLPLAKGAEPDPEEVLDAAHLAVHFSPLRGATRALVHVARRKEVHKPKGAPPGLVTLSGGKTLRLDVEPERLRRLLAGADGPRGSRGSGRGDGGGADRSA